jgi:hypothetical protein
MKILDFFLFLWVIFALRIRNLNADPDPDPATQIMRIHADPDPKPFSEEPVRIYLLAAKSSFYLPAFEISRSCRAATHVPDPSEHKITFRQHGNRFRKIPGDLAPDPSNQIRRG